MNRTVKDGLFGLVGGIAGTVVIGQVMSALARLESDRDKKKVQRLVPEPPTEKLARKISENVFGIELSRQRKSTLGQVVQWSYGIFWGGVYGVLRRRVPAASWGAGLPFGVAFGLMGPAVLLPAMGLTPPATKFPASEHIRGLVSHYAYAATAEGVCELCEKIERSVSGEQLTNAELRSVS
jgi:uncharacterized membrane protein YagU involved in acid resistance